MKKIVVMSDNHGDDYAMEWIKELESDADYYVHCGDSEASDKRLLNGYICVQGNNDWNLDLPRFAKFKAEGLTFLVTHGQFYGYFNREKLMMVDLKKHRCDVMLSGHSHIPHYAKIDKYQFLNPGSTRLPRGGSARGYAVIYVDGKNLSYEFKEL